MIPFSVLDLAPVAVGSNAGQALRNTLDLARHAERLGFRRYWLAEHHGMAGIASAATAVVIGQVAAATTRIRVGAGGIMLPNHAPLVIAEQFGTLAALFPDRIDLGLGRAPGTDQITARALRRNLAASAEEFPQDVIELMAYLGPPDPAQPVRAIPGEGTQVPIWILGSSLFGAQLAAALGLPFAFASHFAPAQMQQAVDIYRSQFRPSQQLQSAYVMVGYNVFAADTDEQAQLLASSMQQAFVALRSGRPGKLPPPVPGYLDSLSPMERSMLDQVLSCSAIGAPDTVQARMASFIERVQPDELIITSQMFEHTARLHSYEIVTAVHAALSA
ncbi:LLM class flavin-dependent oxidoreductase [Immundisolibacter cernigliae]|uniref:Luciferase-like monooxygenase n=1 Tax=Immundisolibacter cernigliae TaxID=1810504 RepID=A0A1B1YXF1_9GAMM|nr:LLM class flavin-dependent oxidoreductase [Immundisolibacter cernigliae]ANX05439.1 alkane 1-monooxygenase [Immundisolibacter cernigliae]